MDAEICKQEPVEKLANCSPKNADHVIPLHSVIVFLLGTLVSAIVLDIVPVKNCSYLSHWSRLSDAAQEVGNAVTNVTPTFAVYGKSKSEDHLVHVFNVLERFGYRRVGTEDDWNLLWAHDYPFLTMPSLKNIGTHQLINHLPGCGFITNKVDLSTTPLPFLPRAFRLPSQKQQFLEYSQQNPGILFVEKHNEHRHIAIRTPEEINLNSNDTFVQEFIPNAFLVDGHKFDVGVYVVITSVNPLRVYIYTGDVLFRYCPHKYYPFNASDIDKYVVGDDYLPTWQVPSLVKYYERLGGSMRGVFDAYVRDQNLDPATVWTQVEDIVRRTILAKEQDIVDILRSYKTHNFFELMRFDLIIDDKLKVHLMEANMSPNLSSAHFKPNSLLYEQILYSVLSLVGVGSPVRTELPLDQRTAPVGDMIASDRQLSTNLNGCARFDCDISCNRDECDLCLDCLSGSKYEILRKAHNEHLHRISMKRLFPKQIINLEAFDINTEVQNLSSRNAWMTRWFYHKCLYDVTWCI